LGCIENQHTGREARSVVSNRPVRASSERQKRIVVVGAGPGGLQAAIAAARDGNHVTVLERERVPGGQVRLAASVPNRAEFGDMVRNQVDECHHLGVTIEYGIEATVDTIRERQPDRVIVATGADPQRPWWIDPAVTNACDVRDVLTGKATPAGSIVVIDEIGFHHATSVAELLADRGHTVEIVTPGMVVGQDLGITLDMEQWWMRATAKGIVQSTDLVPMGFDGSTLTLMQHQTGATENRAPDWVVLAVPGVPADMLYHELLVTGCPVERVGDCVAPRRAHAAVIEGERAGAGV
jgi:2,4-dienoyl-CoA reductase (NADPH2)